MGNYLILLTALLPIAILVYYIYHKDKKSPEPTRQLVKAFFYGILSVPLSFCMSIPLGLIGVYLTEATSIWGSVSAAFFGAAIPEEIAKFIMLWLLLQKNPYFDEKMDGIFYAVCMSLGFVALENIFHTIHNQRNSSHKWHPIDCILGILPQNMEVWKSKDKKHLDRDDDRNNQSNCSII